MHYNFAPHRRPSNHTELEQRDENGLDPFAPCHVVMLYFFLIEYCQNETQIRLDTMKDHTISLFDPIIMPRLHAETCLLDLLLFCIAMPFQLVTTCFESILTCYCLLS